MPATRALALNRVKLCILFAFLAAGASAQAPGKHEPRLTLRKGAALQDVLRELARATGVPVVCQAPQYQRTLHADVKDQPLPAALNEISRSYHLHWLHTPTSIVFVRRLWDERETTDLEVEELHSVAVDALRLVGPLVPVSPWDLSASVARRDFYRSLNPRQLELMQRGGLPWQGLGDAQRAAFLRLSSQSIYDDLLMDAEKAVEIFGAWNRCRLVYLHHEVRGQMKRLLWLEFPWTRDERGFGRIQVEDEPREGYSDQPRASGELLSPETVKGPAALRAIVEFTEGPIRLKALAEASGRALKGDLRVPVWAEERELLVFGTRASAGSVLDAVALLYGWGVKRERRREWSLGRPPVLAPRDYAEATLPSAA